MSLPPRGPVKTWEESRRGELAEAGSSARGKQGKQSSHSTLTAQLRPAGQCRAADMIYCLAAIVPLSGACTSCHNSSEGSKIRRAVLGSGSADRPLQHHGTARQRWPSGTRHQSRLLAGKGICTWGQGAQPHQSPFVSLPRTGHGSRGPTKGQWEDPHAPPGREGMASSALLPQAETRAALASTNKCPLPTELCSANVASRAQVTFPWKPCPCPTMCG